MNIFYLDADPAAAAAAHCDKHVVKMVLETAQLLSTAHRVIDGDTWADSQGLYRATHAKHPSAVWARLTNANYQWLWRLLATLCQSYTKRYGRIHKVEMSGLLRSLGHNPEHIRIDGFTKPPQCMPDAYKQPDTVAAYRAYYIGEKAGFARWQYTPAPAWWPSA